MLGRRDDAFPFAAVRDLLGLVRAMYAAAKGARPERLAELEAIGRELDEAYGLAAQSSPDSVGSRAAWARAERATRRLGDLVQLTDAAEPIVRAAMRRVRGGP